MSSQASRAQTRSHRYAVRWPSGFGGLPSPRSWPRLNGRNRVACPVQPGRHRDRVGVDREVHERPPAERDVLRVPVRAVLLDRVLDVLAGQVVLQLRRRDRDAVDEQAQVERLVRLGIERQLAGDRQPVRVVVRDQLRRDPERRLAIGEPDLDVLIADAVPQDVDRPALIDLLRQPLREPPARELLVAAVGLDQLLPLRRLGLFDEREQLRGVQAELRDRSRVATPSRSRPCRRDSHRSATRCVADLILQAASRSPNSCCAPGLLELAGDGRGDERLAALLQKAQLPSQRLRDRTNLRCLDIQITRDATLIADRRDRNSNRGIAVRIQVRLPDAREGHASCQPQNLPGIQEKVQKAGVSNLIGPKAHKVRGKGGRPGCCFDKSDLANELTAVGPIEEQVARLQKEVLLDCGYESGRCPHYGPGVNVRHSKNCKVSSRSRCLTDSVVRGG